MKKIAAVYYADRLAGCLEQEATSYRYWYDKSYLESEAAKPISLTLPLRPYPYHSNVLFPFFDGLIAEGWLLEKGLEYWCLNPKDRFELLFHLCDDTIGAISIQQIKGKDHA